MVDSDRILAKGPKVAKILGKDLIEALTPVHIAAPVYKSCRGMRSCNSITSLRSMTAAVI